MPSAGADLSLVERDEALGGLGELLAAVRRGEPGRLVLLGGEAGAGKTAVVSAFVDGLQRDVLVLVGACDSLRTARPFGPLLDWAAVRAPQVATMINGGAPRPEIFEAALHMLSQGLTVAVLEDLHWADEATLDLLAFLGRRLHRTETVLLATYRADEVGPPHPLATVLGELSTVRPVRVAVPPLSADAVARLAGGRAIDAADLHRRTGGNAFFVTECMSAGAGEDVAATARDAVLARAARLDRDARAALDIVAAVPGRAELWLIAAMGAPGSGVDECVTRGLLVAEAGAVRFRHEIAREAVHSALPPVRCLQIHVRAVAALRSRPVGSVDHARVAHHAAEAGDVDGVLTHAPLAAAAAEAAGARRQSVAHLELAVQHADRLDRAARVHLLSRLADQLNLLGRHDDAIKAYDAAIQLAAEAGDDPTHGELLARKWSPLSMTGDVKSAAAAADAAIAILEGRHEGRGLALAYAQRCSIHMLARELDTAVEWGTSAIEMAVAHADHEVLAYTLIQSGVAVWMGGDETGLDRLREGIEVARAHGLPRLVAQGLSQIGSGGGEIRRYAEAVPALEEAVELGERYELGSRGLYASAWLARCHLDLGRWDQAAAALSAALRSPRCDGITRMTALTDLGRLRARRGDPEVWPPLDEAHASAHRGGHLQRVWPFAVARAEAAWLEGRLHDEVGNLCDVYGLAQRLQYPWAIGGLGYWLRVAGVVTEASGAAEPYLLHIDGRPVEAARAWARLGCVYEEALALSDSGNDDHQLAAFACFEALGAKPAARRLADRRRAKGLVVPRGPKAATRANPAGLTDRELEVLRLIAAGCTNGDIGERLHISVKTAGHHVSHVLTKLGARSRAEAVATAADAGIPLNRT